jgi:hypothetical protein
LKRRGRRQRGNAQAIAGNRDGNNSQQEKVYMTLAGRQTIHPVSKTHNRSTILTELIDAAS